MGNIYEIVFYFVVFHNFLTVSDRCGNENAVFSPLLTVFCVANDLLCLCCCCCCCCCNPFACCKTNQRCCLLLWGTGSELQHRTMSCIQWQSQRKWNCKKSHSQQAVTAVENCERGSIKSSLFCTPLNIFTTL